MMPAGKRCPYTGMMCGEGTTPAAITPKEKPLVEAVNPAVTAAPATSSKRKSVTASNIDLSKYVHRQFYDMEDFTMFRKAYNAPIPKWILAYGPKGSGKSFPFEAFAQSEGIEYFPANMNGGITPEGLIGQWVPLTNGGFAWSDGILTRVVRNGGLIVVEEINAAPREATFAFHSLGDNKRCLVLVEKDGEVVKAHPKFWLCATMNPDYAGTQTLNEALRDRFSLQIPVNYDIALEKAILTDKYIAAFAKSLRNPRAAGKFPDISTRQLLFLQDNKARFGSRVAYQLFVNAVGGDNASKEALRMFGETANVFNSATIETLEREVNNLMGI